MRSLTAHDSDDVRLPKVLSLRRLLYSCARGYTSILKDCTSGPGRSSNTKFMSSTFVTSIVTPTSEPSANRLPHSIGYSSMNGNSTLSMSPVFPEPGLSGLSIPGFSVLPSSLPSSSGLGLSHAARPKMRRPASRTLRILFIVSYKIISNHIRSLRRQWRRHSYY